MKPLLNSLLASPSWRAFLRCARADRAALSRSLDPALDDIVPANAKVEKVAGNFGFTEGPVWVRSGGYFDLQRHSGERD